MNERKKLNYSKGNYVALNEGLRGIDWDGEFKDCESVEEMWQKFRDKLLRLVEINVPVRTKRSAASIKKGTGRWLSKATISKIKDRKRAWVRYRQFRTEQGFMEYKRLRNEAVSRIRKDQKDYRTGILKSFKGNPKKFFGYIRNKNS